jgi:serine/threonine-protein kinase
VSLEQFKTQVLLLHSEQSTLDKLSTGFNDRYSVHCATSGTEALSTLGQTPIHVIISAQNLPGMSGLDALREARKRSPDMVGILLAGSDQSDGLEAMVGEQEVFEIVRGEVKPDDLTGLIEKATRRVRLMAIAESANDNAANLDVSADEFDMSSGEHIVMETAENGSTIISDGTGTLPTLKPERIQVAPNSRGRNIDILVLSKDEEFLATIKESSLGLHDVHHAVTPSQAEEFVGKKSIGVLVTDAAMVGSNIEALTQRLRIAVPRLVAIVAGRRDDGELLMDLINRGQVYRFLLKPVSPGRVRLAIEASVKHHLDAADSAFKGKPRTAPPPIKPAPAPTKAKIPAAPKKVEPAISKAEKTPARPDIDKKPPAAKKPEPMRAPVRDEPPNESADLDAAFNEGSSFTETMTDIAASVGKSISGASNSISTGTKAIVESSGKTFSGVSGMMKNPKVPMIAGGLVVVAIAATWMMMGDSPDIDDTMVTTEPSVPTAEVAEEASVAEPLPEIADTQAVSGDFLQSARDARDAGNIVSPAGANAVEYYLGAVSDAPGDEVIAGELDALIEAAFGLAETALLANQTTEAARALRVIGLAVPESPRLNFLTVQLNQQRFGALLDQARVATDEARFEDAGRLLLEADGLSVADSGELDALSAELAAARSEQQVVAEDQRQMAAQQAEAERVAAAAAAANRAETERVAAE